MLEQLVSGQLQAVVQLSGFVLNEDWEQAKPFLTDDKNLRVLEPAVLATSLSPQFRQIHAKGW